MCDYSSPSAAALAAIRRYTGFSTAVLARYAGASLEDWMGWEAGLASMPAAAAWLLALALIYHT
jgi:DNA-binding transcriptional regulator YiaG